MSIDVDIDWDPSGEAAPAARAARGSGPPPRPGVRVGSITGDLVAPRAHVTAKSWRRARGWLSEEI